jgi:hypothetical protein
MDPALQEKAGAEDAGSDAEFVGLEFRLTWLTAPGRQTPVAAHGNIRRDGRFDGKGRRRPRRGIIRGRDRQR